MTLVAGGTGLALTAAPASAEAVPCTVDYQVQNKWSTGFTAAVTVTDNGAAKSSWSPGSCEEAPAFTPVWNRILRLRRGAP